MEKLVIRWLDMLEGEKDHFPIAGFSLRSNPDESGFPLHSNKAFKGAALGTKRLTDQPGYFTEDRTEDGRSPVIAN